MKEKCINIVFTGMPGPKSKCVFIEVEDDNGNSVNIGEWRKRHDGLVELHITKKNIKNII